MVWIEDLAMFVHVAKYDNRCYNNKRTGDEYGTERKESGMIDTAEMRC